MVIPGAGAMCHLGLTRARSAFLYKRAFLGLCACSGGGGGGYSHILAIQVCAAGKGMVFKPFSLV